jgi:hypothetical protein
MPFAHPELIEPIFAAGVTRRRLCDGFGIEQRGGMDPEYPGKELLAEIWQGDHRRITTGPPDGPSLAPPRSNC